MYNAFATCPKGLQELLRKELFELGGNDIRESPAGVNFTASLALLYRACLWSRFANRILLEVHRFDVGTIEDLYAGIRAVPWDEHLSITHTFAVSFTGTNEVVRQTNFGALKTKDAIVDWFRDHTGQRPSVDTKCPDLRIQVNLRRRRVTISIDLSGDSLHKRGYRVQGSTAPLKENLAAAILQRSNWPDIASNGGSMIDPMCGSGTLLIEAAQMAMNVAPGLLRQRWGFSAWNGHKVEILDHLLTEAHEKRTHAMQSSLPSIIGYDDNEIALRAASLNIEQAQLSGYIQLKRRSLRQLSTPPRHADTPGLVITNPPYGKRLGDESSLIKLYALLGQKLRTHYEGWRAGVLTGNPILGKTMGIRADKQYALFNGTIASKLLVFDLRKQNFVREDKAGVIPTPRLSPGAQMFANRLSKNVRHLDKWRRRNTINCYRVYDADIPEYSVAVDVYNDWVHVGEYKAPISIDSAVAEQHLREVVSAIPSVLGTHPEKIVIKQRQRQRTSTQYEKRSELSQLLEVQEGKARLLVNLHDYLDTGLFLDHRRLRASLEEIAKGKRFLNLFCYAASATVHAALGGAIETVSVDLSRTYIDWARSNFELNAIDENRHRLIKADCRKWITENQKWFDVILLDPPTFSNSKGMDGTFEVERDHASLIDASMQRLSGDGVLIFSSNRRKFELNRSIEKNYRVKDMTSWSVDRDYSRHNLPHRCWFINHRKP